MRLRRCTLVPYFFMKPHDICEGYVTGLWFNVYSVNGRTIGYVGRCDQDDKYFHI